MRWALEEGDEVQKKAIRVKNKVMRLRADVEGDDVFNVVRFRIRLKIYGLGWGLGVLREM